MKPTATVTIRETTLKYVEVPLDDLIGKLPRGYSRDLDGVNLWLRHSKGQHPTELRLRPSFGRDTGPTVYESVSIA